MVTQKLSTVQNHVEFDRCRDELIAISESNDEAPKVVYGVYHNADMTEGRGPFVLDRIYRDEDAAWAYADQQPGVFDRSNRGSWRDRDIWPYGGDWIVKPLVLY